MELATLKMTELRKWKLLQEHGDKKEIIDLYAESANIKTDAAKKRVAKLFRNGYGDKVLVELIRKFYIKKDKTVNQ